MGIIKGVILSICPSADLVDLTHEITPQDVLGACLTLEAALPFFPEGTVHLVVVDPGIHVSTARVFARLDAGLTPRENSNSIFYFVSRELEGSGAFRFLVNDLEAAALEEAPALRDKAVRIRATLAGAGARLSALSGSGSCWFAERSSAIH